MNQDKPSEPKFISLSSFVQSLRKQKVADNSIESYVSDLKAFLQSQDVPVDAIEHSVIARFFSSRSNHISSIS